MEVSYWLYPSHIWFLLLWLPVWGTGKKCRTSNLTVIWQVLENESFNWLTETIAHIIKAFHWKLWWPKRLKHKSISQNTSQFPKAHNGFPIHKLISRNTNMFSKTQINFPKHKSISQNTISKDWALPYYERDGLERRVTNSGPGSFASNMATIWTGCIFIVLTRCYREKCSAKTAANKF